MLPPISHHIVLDAPVETAFDVFATKLGDWWPLVFTFSGADFLTAMVEPRAGDRWFERTRKGDEISWGDVRVYERSRRVVVGFAIGPDRKPVPTEKASEVEIRFLSAAGGTRVEVEHRDFERHGEGAKALRDGMDSFQGWPILLAELRRGVERVAKKAASTTIDRKAPAEG
jgi:uncharacterized protein YndB with AHSA1/START domain